MSTYELKGYKILKEIGAGTYGVVFLAEDTQRRNQCIIKKIKIKDIRTVEKQAITQEVLLTIIPG